MHRLISILLLIESKGTIKARELASKLETSTRTIYRDIDTLCEAGIPIATTTGPKGGIHFMEGYSVDINKLQGDDIVNLYLSSLGIKPDISSDVGIKVQNALLKLEKNVPIKYRNEFKKAKDRFYFDNTQWWGKETKITSMDSIVNSVWQSTKLEITYSTTDHYQSSRIIHPYGIVVKRSDWYLVAYCEKRKDLRTFRCERIASVKELDETFSIPIEFKLSEYWARSERDFKENCAEQEVYLAKIKIHKDNTELLKNLEIISVEEKSDYIIATVNMHGYELACHETMNIVGNIEVLQPKELRSFVQNKLDEIVKLYND